MGIKLDWEIEAEQSHVKSAGEDPATARRRRRARLKLVLFVMLIVGIIGGIAAFINYRLHTVDEEIENLLRNTVDAEVTALRLGDWNAFSLAQRSASGDWLQQQQQTFQDYQTLKQQQKIQLTGQILDLMIDKTRGRVKVEEIIEGTPYTRVWFYWRYDDGWRHVPPDYTFWGDVQQFNGKGILVRYQTVDEPLAKTMGAQLETWLQTTCAALICTNLPEINVDIVPDDSVQVSWSANNPWLLLVPSPYLKRARTDTPFDTGLQLSVANTLAERLVTQASGDLKPTYPADVYYLRQAVVSWLVGQFVQFDTNAFIISSLAKNYGAPAVGRLLQALRPDSDVSVFNTVTGVSALNQTNLDWRDFLTWRLVTERELIKRRDENNFLLLYDTRDDGVRNLAAQRFSELQTDSQPVVVSSRVETRVDGVPIIRALAQTGSKDSPVQQELIFRLSDGIWRRAN
jgi:hypothetical protein